MTTVRDAWWTEGQRYSFWVTFTGDGGQVTKKITIARSRSDASALVCDPNQASRVLIAAIVNNRTVTLIVYLIPALRVAFPIISIAIAFGPTE